MRTTRLLALFAAASSFAFLALMSSTPAVNAAEKNLRSPSQYTSLAACGVQLSWWRELRWKRSCANATDWKQNAKYCQMLCGAQASLTSFGGSGGPGGPGGLGDCVGANCPPIPCVGSSCEPPTTNAKDHGNHYGNDKPDNDPIDVNNRFDTSPNIHPGGGKPEDAGKPG